MQQRILTASEINSSERNKLIVLNDKMKLFNKKKIGEQFDIMGGLSNLTKEQKQEVIDRVENSPESKKHREKLIRKLGQETSNLKYFRRNISDLNDLDEYAHLVEECNIQNVEDFVLLEYNDVLNVSQQNTHLIPKITDLKREAISSHIPIYEKDLDTLELLVVMRKMYKIENTIGDMELYEMFEAETNIDYAHKMSDIILTEKTSENILNSLLDGTQLKKLGIASLVNQKIISNRLFGVLLSRDYVTNNQVTLLENSFTNNESVINVYKTRTIGELLFEITNDENQFLVKEMRHQIYMTFDGMRPSGSDYHKWNGMQVLDLDLKKWMALGNSLTNLKTLIHRELSKYHWYMWTCLSTSANGLHIYTKVTPPHHVYLDVHKNESMCKYWYKVNYVTKYNTVNSILQYLSDNYGNKNIKFDEQFENKYLDVSVGRITSGIKVTYDSDVLVNENFVDLHVGLGLTQTINVSGTNHYGDKYSNIQEITKYLKRENSKLIDIINREMLVDEKIKIEEIDLSKFVKLNSSFNEDKITELPRKSINYVIRWNVCNTLASLYGKDGLVFAHKILNSAVCQNESEINAFYQTAITSNKKATRIGLEILKRAGLIKFTQEVDEAGVEIENPLLVETEDIYRKELREAIMKSIHNAVVECDYKLGENEYLSHIKDQLLQRITGNKITVILSPPGTGKTELIKTLARDGKRILLVLPYVSVINNKIVTDESITEMFDSFYGDKDFKTLEHGRNAVTTFDKFSKSNYEKLSNMFDYIFIDESHLLFVSQYRVEATSFALKKIKDLFYISNNSPISAKIVLLTGTETGESFFFNKVSNIIRVTKKQIEKHTEFHICGDLLDATTRLVSVARDYLNKGYKLMIPTNAGEIYVERMVGMLNYLRGDEGGNQLKYGYYKSANKEQEICQLIDGRGTIGDYDIVFCTNYLSVGVDINDKHHKFASLFFGNFCAFEIEQFNARIRKTAIESHIFVATTKSNGDFLPQMMEEPNLLLRVNEEDLANFGDDKIISGAKQEFIAEYDPVLFKISTPGFNIFNGKIQFNQEEYELINFENKLLECMSHPIKISRELAKYGCNITVSTENRGLSLLEQKILKKVGTQSALTEKIRKHDLMIQTYRDLIEGNTNINEHDIEFNNSIDWIIKNPKLIKEDRLAEKHVRIEYSLFGQPEYVVVKSREYLDKIIKNAKFISEKYTKIRALNFINDFINNEGVLNVSEFERNIKLLKIIDKSNAGELSEPIQNLMDKIYAFINQFDANKNYGISLETYQSQIENWCFDYMDSLNISVGTKYAFEKFRERILDILQTLSIKSKTKYGIRFRYNTVGETDGHNSRMNVEQMVLDLFKLTRETNSKKTQSNIEKHIIEQYF